VIVKVRPQTLHRRVAVYAAVRRLLVVQRARRQAVGLGSSQHEGARKLAQLLLRIADDDLPAAEERRLQAVERERARLLRSDDYASWSGGRQVSIGWICAKASQPAAGARVLFHAVATWRPELALELGTCVGLSGAYQASAQAVNGGGRFVSMEAYPDLAAEARRVWAACGLTDASVVVGSFADSLPEFLSNGACDYAFLDGHHDGDATRRYVHQIAQEATPGALVVLDDIDYSPSMRGAWHDVRHRSDVVASADLGKIGLVVLR
jgi:predicted O-methyltransferase YrrM